MPRTLGKRQGKLRDQNYDCRPTSVCRECRAHAADGTRIAIWQTAAMPKEPLAPFAGQSLCVRNTMQLAATHV